MPIQLPPISRRQFVARLGAAAGSMALASAWRADAASPDPHLWALLSDTHIDANPETTSRGIRMSAHLTKVVAELALASDRPAGVLINGDCAYLKGEPGDYAQLGRLLAPLRSAGMPVHLLLGNHDHRANIIEGMTSYWPADRPVPGRLVALVRSPRVNWFLLDSLDQTNVTPGLLGAEQMAWLTRLLDSNRDRPAIIVAHHNLERGEPKSGLKDAAELLPLLESRRQVKAYIYGHTHNWGIQQTDSGLHCVNLPPVAYVFQAGKPSGHVLARVEPNGVRLQLRSVETAHPLHDQQFELPWRRD